MCVCAYPHTYTHTHTHTHTFGPTIADVARAISGVRLLECVFCMYIRHTYTCVCVYICIHKHAHAHILTHTWSYQRWCGSRYFWHLDCKNVCGHVYTAHTNVCVYTHIHTHTHTHTFGPANADVARAISGVDLLECVFCMYIRHTYMCVCVYMYSQTSARTHTHTHMVLPTLMWLALFPVSGP